MLATLLTIRPKAVENARGKNPRLVHVADMPHSSSAPPLRCAGRGENAWPRSCGRPAVRAGVDDANGKPAFFCERCARPSDVPIARHSSVLEVSLVVDVTFAGVSLDDARAKSEAIKTLELAVGIAGGRVTVHGARAFLGTHYRADGKRYGPGRPG